MAATQSRRRKGKSKSRKSNTNLLVIGVGVLVLGLLAYGMLQVFAPVQSAGADANNAPVTTASREAQFLGPPSDPAGLSLAEAGSADQPTLVWFHADWCHVCQQIKPEVIDLGAAFDGKVKFVRLNIDHAENRSAVQRYGVRATPTFVLIDADGQLRGNVPGWPGSENLTAAFDTLLTES